MEQVYRRREERGAYSRFGEPQRHIGYRKAVLRQSAFCLFLFAACLLIKIYPEKRLEPVRHSVQMILETQTDFAAFPEQLRSFIRTYLFREDEDKLNRAEVLTDLSLPVEAAVSSPFGLRTHPADGSERFHYGVDLGAAEGEKIKAAADGTVSEAGESADYGRYILLQHTDGIYTLYAHCREILPQAGDSVAAGQVIATVGATGNATGPHLHFEIRNGEAYLNPEDFMSFPASVAHD